jgi:lon-related putative ATP-dependent protease
MRTICTCPAAAARDLVDTEGVRPLLPWLSVLALTDGHAATQRSAADAPDSPPRVARELTPAELCVRCDPHRFAFETTAELEPLSERVGQQRAVEALEFGVSMRADGYHMFAMGPPHAGKHSAVRQVLVERAAAEPVPRDVCYVTDFGRPHVPRALLFDPGKGALFRRDVTQLVDDLGTAIQNALDSEEHRARKEAIANELKGRHEAEFRKLGDRAEQRGLSILQTPMGLVLAPLKAGEIIPPDAFAKLPDDERERYQKDIEEFGEELRRHVEEVPRWQHEARRQLRDLVHRTVRTAVGHLIDDLKTKYAAYPAAVEHLTVLGDQVVVHGSEFVKEGDEAPGAEAFGPGEPGESPYRRYLVNLFVDHSRTRGAPVVYEDHPTIENMVGRVEHRSHLGMLVTDLHLMKAGALHRANGGYLILDARNLLVQPLAWEALKRALLGKQIRIESLGQMMSLVTTVSLEPEPVPLDVKVVLLGDRTLFYLLEELEPDFHALFKVVVDFEDAVDRTPHNDLLYARLLGTMARDASLLPLDRAAVAGVLDHAARLAGDSGKVTGNMGTLADLLHEGHHLASRRGAARIEAQDVDAAIGLQQRRAGRLRERVLEEIRDGTLMIDTDGAQTGQVNGLSVVELGSFAFGHPVRITARARVGQGSVVDIEREVELGGPIHSKGVLILSGLLAARYASDSPLSLSATLVFEQSYGGVEGDSASTAELYALLSALAQVPALQSIAVTGSVNQHGEVQPVGGINEKIEGFFDVCCARGLTGGQGVMVPHGNVRHLMLRRPVVEAVRAGRFHVWPVRTIDEGIELLTGLPAGDRGGDGRFPPGSVNAMVEERLLHFAATRASARGLAGQ